MSGWIGVDFDATLVKDNTEEPVPAMVERIRGWLKKGYEVRIVTARVSLNTSTAEEVKLQKNFIAWWTQKYIGKALQATAEKDYHMWQLWDDRAVTVERDTGRPLGVPARGLL